jgi:hypothetical protein
LPGTRLEDSHGHTGFLVRGKRFAWLLVDHHGDGRLALWVKAPPGEQESLVSADARRFFVPPYLGPKGWVGIDLAADPDWSEIRDLMEQAWRMNATTRALAAFDAEQKRRRP